ncbi:MAG: putative sporulation protein YtxC [Clostridia bacterium]|nr:putative sporulation protein YtxC [Clostridia bacterium]
MKSVCIKLTNQKTVKYLLEELDNFEIENIYFSCKKFKIYYNVIIHYKGKNLNLFLKSLAEMLSFTIIDLYEENIIKNLIKSEYFYFEPYERQKIANITSEDLYELEEAVYPPKKRFKIIYQILYDYLNSNRSIILKGFITFRIKAYFETLLEQIDKSVSKFIVEKEYAEFISLLKIYVNSEKSTCKEVHLIYYNFKPILLDENKNIIKIEDDSLSSKYLSDITFSSNDYTLNTLLNLVPKKIHIHLIDENIDEFINTLKLIFEERVDFCNDCEICKIYQKRPAIKT